MGIQPETKRELLLRSVCISFAVALALSACGESGERGAEPTAPRDMGSGDGALSTDDAGDISKVVVEELTDGVALPAALHHGFLAWRPLDLAGCARKAQ